MPTFEIVLYNHDLRRALDTGELNETGFSDDWAECRYLTRRAADDLEARAWIERDYPPHLGFVIVRIDRVLPGTNLLDDAEEPALG